MDTETLMEGPTALALESFLAEMIDLDSSHGRSQSERARGPKPERQQQPLLDGRPPDRERSPRRATRATDEEGIDR